MTNWKEYKFSEFVDINPKVTLKKGVEYSFIEMKDLSEGNKFVIPSQKRELTGGSRFENGDTLFARITPCLENGKICQVKGLENGVGFGSTEFLVFRGKADVSDTNFVHYLCLSDEVRRFAEQNMVGTSGRQRVSWQAFENLELSIPDLPTQTAIAEILSSLDDKIELNNKINQELENLAQTLFKQWFINFEFPNENGEPYKSSGGEMMESALGEIPRALSICKISDLRPKLETGKRPKGGVKGIESGMPSVGAESIKGVGYFDYTKTKYVPFEYATNMRRGIVSGFELLIYKDGGKPGTFIPHFGMFGEGYPFDEFVINEHVFLLDFGNKDYNCFSYFFFDSPYVKPILENSGGKAAIPGINQGDINNLSIFHPSNPLVKKFQEIAHCCISTILINCKENTYLTNLRDTLLPKLISGELAISQALPQTNT